MAEESTILVDCDSIVYRSGFAGQKQQPGGWLEVEPLPNVLHSVKATLGKIRDRLESDRLEIYLTASHGKSFRHELAKQRAYKGNRTKPRPYHYDAIRQYLVDHHGAKVVTTREADDELSIRARQLERDGKVCCIATIDKDLDQIPGYHYNYSSKDVLYVVSEEEAERWFWIQCLSGDPTDNVPGCYEVGPKGASAIVDELMAKDASPEDIWIAVVEQYSDSQTFDRCPYRDCLPEDVALETAQLVYLQRKPGELWFPPQAGGPKIIEAMKEVDEF